MRVEMLLYTILWLAVVYTVVDALIFKDIRSRKSKKENFNNYDLAGVISLAVMEVIKKHPHLIDDEDANWINSEMLLHEIRDELLANSTIINKEFDINKDIIYDGIKKYLKEYIDMIRRG